MQPRQRIEKLEILNLSSEGKGVARHNDKVIFIDDTVTGDVVDVEIFKKKKSFAFAKPLHFHSYSEKRTQPFCAHFEECGGCKIQHLDYAGQLEYKQQTVLEAFQRIGHLEFPEINAIIPARETQYYRNKLEYTFSNKRWLTSIDIEETLSHRNGLGFHKAGHYDKVLDVEQCFLQPEPSNAIRLAVREYAQDNGLSFYDIRNQVGLLRNLIIRTSSSGEIMVVVSFAEDDKVARDGLLAHIMGLFPGITSLQYVINPGRNDAFLQYEVKVYAGAAFIYESLDGLKFKIGPKSFFQTNTKQAEALYAAAKKMASLKKEDTVYDLYSGVGSIGLYMADNCREVFGIEEVAASVKDAQENAALNNIKNCHFYAGDVLKILIGEKLPKPDVIIVDPPRAGMHKDAVAQIKQLGAGRIVYISCNPATQARDLELLSSSYTIKEVQPIDMFPHTPHIENIVLLELKLS